LVAPAPRIAKRLILAREAGKKTSEDVTKPAKETSERRELLEELADANPQK
jgi:hypothetical protein